MHPYFKPSKEGKSKHEHSQEDLQVHNFQVHKVLGKLHLHFQVPRSVNNKNLSRQSRWFSNSYKNDNIVNHQYMHDIPNTF